jgi:hypothetical protein
MEEGLRRQQKLTMPPLAKKRGRPSEHRSLNELTKHQPKANGETVSAAIGTLTWRAYQMLARI